MSDKLYRIKSLVWEKDHATDTWYGRCAIPNKGSYIVAFHKGEWKCRKHGGGKFWPCHTKEEGVSRMEYAYQAFIERALEEDK